MTVDLRAFCVGESLCKLQMFGVKARLSCKEKSYECVNCNFVIKMIKGSPRGIVYHTTPTNNRKVVRGSVDLSNKEDECSERHKAFFPPGCGATLLESSSTDL